MTEPDTATYYMVEMDYPHETEAERMAFDGFYQRHIDMLLVIPGFLSAQRFHCREDVRAPFLALYRVAGPEVLTSEAYMSKAGRMSVDPDFRVNMTNWDRNLVQGPTGSDLPDLAVEMGDAITMIDRSRQGAPPLPPGFTPLEIVGLDWTIEQRGVAPGDSGADTGGAVQGEGWEIRVWWPIHPIRLSNSTEQERQG